MITVECSQCPIRNFCPSYELKKRKDVPYGECPIYRVVEESKIFKKAQDILVNKD